jgi:Subtilase family
MKKLIVISALLFSTLTPTAHADTAPAIAVIDSGEPTALFSNIVGEYCVVESGYCPNNMKTMDGPGASNIAPSTNSALTHGSEMLSIINQVNPTAKLVPIRIIGITNTGLPYLYTLNAVKSALDWVVLNSVKYNIKIVSISQGAIFAGCAVPVGFAEDVNALKAQGVSVVAATGNSSNRTAMFSPACLPSVISVGATDNPDPGSVGKAWDPTAKPYIARYSNGTPQTIYYTNARFYTTQPNGTRKFMVGTSNATAAMSAFLLNNPNPTTTTASNEWLMGKYVFIP